MKDTYEGLETLNDDYFAKAALRDGFYRNYGKRAFDLTIAVILFPILAPVIGVLWLLARCDGGPGFFGHNRVGKGGSAFRCWKIRTMVDGAEQKLQAYLESNPSAAAEWALDQKLTDDPRVTRLGAFLRKTSLDELPQIWNVLTGEMSFVGPRPIVRDELAKYGVSIGAYLEQKPGITGLWQVSGRNDVSYSTRVQLDVEYNKRKSLASDVRLILLTGWAIVGVTGR